MKRILAITSIFVLFSLFFSDTAFSRTCMNFKTAMDGIKVRAPIGSKSVFVSTFENFTKSPGDNWLTTGIRNYLAELLSTGNLNVEVEGAPGTYIVTGQFQRMGPNLRIFVKFVDAASGNLIKLFEVNVAYPDNKEFFEKLATAVDGMFKIAEVSYNSDKFFAIRSATDSTRAYEGYSNGIDVLSKYDPGQMSVAKRYFEDVKRIDYRSPLGYEGLLNLYAFLGFYHRQSGEAYGSYFELAEKELVSMTRLAKPAPLLMTRAKAKVVDKEKPEVPKVDSPLILNNIAFNEGLAAMRLSQPDMAIESFRRAVAIVPSDAMSWYYIAKIESTRGNTAESQKALSQAYAINSCVEAK